MNKSCDQFGIRISDKQIQTKARILPPPCIQYSEVGRHSAWVQWVGGGGKMALDWATGRSGHPNQYWFYRRNNRWHRPTEHQMHRPSFGHLFDVFLRVKNEIRRNKKSIKFIFFSSFYYASMPVGTLLMKEKCLQRENRKYLTFVYVRLQFFFFFFFWP